MPQEKMSNGQNITYLNQVCRLAQVVRRGSRTTLTLDVHGPPCRIYGYIVPTSQPRCNAGKIARISSITESYKEHRRPFPFTHPTPACVPDQRQPEASSSTRPPASTTTIPQPQPQPQPPYPPMTSLEQIHLLQSVYTEYPNPDKRGLEDLAARTGRPCDKVKEYFRQRRTKLRGFGDLETKEEPRRASGLYITML